MSRMSENVRAWTSRKPKGLHGLYGDNFTFFFFFLNWLWIRYQANRKRKRNYLCSVGPLGRARIKPSFVLPGTEEHEEDRNYVVHFVVFFLSNSGLGHLHEIVSLQLLYRGQSVGLLGRVISSSQGLYWYTNTEKYGTQHKQQTSMPEAGFEPKITESEWAKTLHASDRSATVTGKSSLLLCFS
jgi:hypothetical protein